MGRGAAAVFEGPALGEGGEVGGDSAADGVDVFGPLVVGFGGDAVAFEVDEGAGGGGGANRGGRRTSAGMTPCRTIQFAP